MNEQYIQMNNVKLEQGLLKKRKGLPGETLLGRGDYVNMEFHNEDHHSVQ